MNKIYNLTLAAVASISASAFASDVVVGGIYYNFDSASKTAEVTYKGNCRCAGGVYTGEIVIPASVAYEGETYSVTTIGEYAFSSARNMTSISIPSSVTSVGKSAFVGCTGLKEVKFAQPCNVTSIGSMAFLACSSLEAVEIPASVETLGRYAFELCTKLSDVKFQEPSSLTEIDQYVFCHTGLDHIVAPASVTSIQDVAFCQNPAMTSVVLPQQITFVSPRNPFCYNTQVTTMVVEQGNTVYDSRQDCNAFIETASNTLISGCKTTVVPASVTAIGRSAFNNVTEMTEQQLPATITSIGKYAYLNCTGLKEFIFPSTMKVMADSVFWKATNLEKVVTLAQKPFVMDDSDFQPEVYSAATLYVPAGTRALYRAAAGWRNFRNVEELDYFVVDGVSYQIVADGQVEVTNAREMVAYSGTVVVPATVASGSETFTVTGIAPEAFEGSDVKAVSLPESLSAQVKTRSDVNVSVRAKADEPAFASIYGQKGYIQIEGSDAEAQVFNAAGQIVVVTLQRSIPMDKGIYVVKIGAQTAKVVVD